MEFAITYLASAALSSRLRVFALPLAVSMAWMSGTIARADQPLHVRIDAQMAELHSGPESPLCSDGEFLRRVYLDLVGAIPSAEQARKFIEDASPDKRGRVVDELLAHPSHAEYMAQVFDVMLMERRADKHVKSEQWDNYLLASFQQNKPFNELAREILAADGADEKQRGPAKFYLEREVEPNLLTREVGRMFFGMDLQCAQCHDHPSIDDYYQSDYYGLFAFVNRSYLFQPDKKKPAVLAEKAEGEATFKSVFTDEEGRTLPRLPGSVEIDEPTFAKDDAYQVKPDPKKKEIRPIPKYSRLQELATRATDGSNPTFNRNLANRLWAHMFGRGLVQPVDQHHSDNPPIHPQLLQMLAEELVKMKFDVKSMLRQLALSRTYQRTMDLPRDFTEHARAAAEQLAGWNQRTVELKKAVERSLAVVEDLEEKQHNNKSKLTELVDAEKKSSASLAASKKTADDAAKAVLEAQQTLARDQTVAQLLAEAVATTTKATGILKDDQDLGDVLKVLQARHQASVAKVAEQTKSLAALAAAGQAATKQLSEAQNVAAETAKAVKATKETVTSLAKTLAESRQKLRFDQTTVAHARQHISRLQIAVDYGEVAGRHDGLKRQSQNLADQLAAARQAIARLTPEVDRLKQELPQAESSFASAAAESAAAKQQLKSTREAANLIAASFDKANQAAQSLSGDAELKAAIDKLAARSRQLSDNAASLDKSAAKSIAREKELAIRVQSLREAMKAASNDLAAATSQSQTLPKQQADVSRQLSDLADELQTRRDALATAWSQQFSIAVVQPLSPEQLAWSILRVTGVIDRQRASVRAALDKKSPLKPEEKNDNVKLAARESEVEKQTETKLRPSVDRFVKLFGAAAGQPQDDFFATADQALFFGNGGELRGWLAPAGGNLTDRWQKTDDPKALAEEMYLSILTRLPTAEEAADVVEYLSSPENKKQEAVQELAWALLTSAEFRFQH